MTLNREWIAVQGRIPAVEMSGRLRTDRVCVPAPRHTRYRCSVGTEANVWLVGDDTEVVVIDAAGDPAAIAEAVADRHVTAVICTQGQPAHTSSAAVIGVELCAPILLHPADHAMWDAIHGNCRYWHLSDGQRIAVAGEEIRVLHTPIATPGSVTLQIVRHNMLFSGDIEPTVHGELSSGAKRAATTAIGLAGVRVYPGHGASFTLGGASASSTDRLVRHSA